MNGENAIIYREEQKFASRLRFPMVNFLIEIAISEKKPDLEQRILA